MSDMKRKDIKNRLAVQNFKFYLIVLSFVIFLPHKSYSYQPKEGKLSASFGPFIHHGDFRSRPEAFYDKSRLGWALVTEAVFAEDWALEVGLFYLKKPYLRETSERFLIEELDRLYITTGARRWWASFFSTGFNFFSSFSMGDPVVVASSGVIDDDFETLATRDSAAVYGLDLSARFELDLSSRDGIFLDLRYSYSLSSQGRDEANHMIIGIFYMREIRVK